MNITDVKVRKAPKHTPFAGIASITIDNELIINDIKIYSREDGYKIVFPNNSIAKQHGKRNIVLLSPQTREQIIKIISEKLHELG